MFFLLAALAPLLAAAQEPGVVAAAQEPGVVDYRRADGHHGAHWDHVHGPDYVEPPVKHFTVEDPDYAQHLTTFRLGDMEFEDNWGYTEAKYLPMDHRGYDALMGRCAQQLKDRTMKLAEYSKYGTVNYYKDTPDYRMYKGSDLIPENRKNYVRGMKYSKTLDYKNKERIMPGEDIMMHECYLDDEGAEGGWRLQRVGPFYSTGDYDWWQIGWSDWGRFSEILDEYPEGVDVDSVTMVPVLEDGTRLGLPPIHIHHIHVVPVQGVRPRNDLMGCQNARWLGYGPVLESTLKQKNCYNSSLFFEQHGDYQCVYEEDGMDCLTTGGPFNTRRIAQPLDIEGELNDVRPGGSEKLKWYYQASIHWKPIDKEIAPVSMMTIMAPGYADESDQLTRAITFPTPTHAEHLLWYTGKMWGDGTLVRNKLHAHNSVFESSEFFLGTAEDLGLHEKRFVPRRSYEPMPTRQLGFNGNEDLRAWIFNNLEESQRRYKQKCDLREDIAADICSRPMPRFLCAAKYNADYVEFSGEYYSFDRRPLTFCEEWTFAEGDKFVVTGFSRRLDKPLKPDTPGYIPATIPGHISWQFWYKHHGWGHSFFSRMLCSQGGVFFDARGQYGIAHLISMGMAFKANEGVPVDFTFVDLMEHVILAVCIVGLIVAFFVLPSKFKRE